VNSPANTPADKVDPTLVFEALNAFQNSAVLAAAIEFDLFSAIGSGTKSAATLAEKCSATERGVRIVCDHLVVQGFLCKEPGEYALTPVSAKFLDRASPAYMGSAARFVHSNDLLDAHRNLAEVVRTGTTQLPQQGTVSEQYAGCVEFARSMGPMMMPAAQFMAEIVAKKTTVRPLRVLDIAAGHGMFGITIAKRVGECEVTAVDWPQVVEVAQENAQQAGVKNYHTLNGDAFTTDFGSGYDVILLTNILHHFNQQKCVELLRKVKQALAPGGKVLTLEFIPNDDRVSPPVAATFALTMLATTPAGDAYTFAEYQQMWQQVGLTQHELLDVPNSSQRLVVTQ